LTAPATIVRLEGAAVAALSIYLFARSDESWLLFAALVLLPDLAIPVYFANKRLGAAAYNLVHAYVWPVALAVYGVAGQHPLAIAIALIWATHIGVDRFAGFGLKYPADFKDTHIQHL
jgi:hypothetical protein